MFDSKTTARGRLTDAVDLLIDFATLGEYGLEPVERRGAPCGSRRRNVSPKGTRRRAPGRRGRPVGAYGG
jgi:hypothetical protein